MEEEAIGVKKKVYKEKKKTQKSTSFLGKTVTMTTEALTIKIAVNSTELGVVVVVVRIVSEKIIENIRKVFSCSACSKKNQTFYILLR
jgi:hypothetical protein